MITSFTIEQASSVSKEFNYRKILKSQITDQLKTGKLFLKFVCRAFLMHMGKIEFKGYV